MLIDMKPITFVCTGTLSMSPNEIVNQILDETRWPDFHGYGPIPGIRIAEMEVRTTEVVGSRIRVTNLDDSTHVEEIVEWKPDERLQLRMGEFSAPLCRLADRFVETWEFQRNDSQTHITRSFEMYAKSMFTWPVLWLISFVLKRAIDQHLLQMNRQNAIPN